MIKKSIYFFSKIFLNLYYRTTTNDILTKVQNLSVTQGNRQDVDHVEETISEDDKSEESDWSDDYLDYGDGK